jgi:DDE superfamily endonuclease
LYMSPYSPEFNPIEHWWSQLKAFLRQFSPTTSKKVDTLIKTAMDLMDPKHLRNWFAHCCYCPCLKTQTSAPERQQPRYSKDTNFGTQMTATSAGHF